MKALKCFKPMNKRIVYIGAERVGLVCLQKLMDLGKNVVAVLTADDSLEYKIADFVSFDENVEKIPLYKVVNTKDPETMLLIKNLKPDLIIVISWSQIIPKEILDYAPLGCIGIHYSLLPERRGGAPLNWAIIDGLRKSGITLFFYNEGVDTGDIIAQKEFEITDIDTPRELLDKICILAPEIIEENINSIENGTVLRIKQDERMATYTKSRKPEDGLIDWNKQIDEIYNFIRAIAPPYPCAFTFLGDKKMAISKVTRKDNKLYIEGVIE